MDLSCCGSTGLAAALSACVALQEGAGTSSKPYPWSLPCIAPWVGRVEDTAGPSWARSRQQNTCCSSGTGGMLSCRVPQHPPHCPVCSLCWRCAVSILNASRSALTVRPEHLVFLFGLLCCCDRCSGLVAGMGWTCGAARGAVLGMEHTQAAPAQVRFSIGMH